MTTSILSFTPAMDDMGKHLSCRAEQSLIPDSGKEDGWTLDIYRKRRIYFCECQFNRVTFCVSTDLPVASLDIGTNLNSSSGIREGDDVYFDCNIKANPWITGVKWMHQVSEQLSLATEHCSLRTALQDKVLHNNPEEGILVANQSLVLQNVSRSRAGLYTCVGRNQVGDGESNQVQLDIKCKFYETGTLAATF